MKKLITLLIIGMIFTVHSNAFDINFLWLWNLFKKKLVWVHFKAGWNNYGWYFFVTRFKDISSSPVSITISPWNEITNCKEQIEWYYYNSLHWQTIYPLDNDSKNYWKSLNSDYYSGLNIIGWLYSSCNGDPNSIYGQIIYKKWIKKLFSVQAWFKYTYTGNKINWEFTNNLQQVYKDGYSNIIWFLYDSVSGIWFVGWHVNNKFKELVNTMNTQKVNNVITSLWDKIWNIVWANIVPMYWIWIWTRLLVEWLLWVWINKGNNSSIFKSFEKNTKKKTIFVKWNLSNISDVMNKLTKNSDIICRWNRNKRTNLSKITSLDNDIWKTICIKTDNSIITITDDLTLNWKNTNIIVKWKQNRLILKSSQSWPGNVNIFIDNGYVLFDNNMNLESIDGNWNAIDVGWVTSWVIFNGNLYVKWLLAWYDELTNTIGKFNHKLYIHGSIASYNTIGVSDSRNKYLMWLWLKAEFADIANTFNWNCIWLKWTDWVNCWNPNDKYWLNSLIIQKKWYKNILLK